ncbi:MAG: hybrid sensor histidine kinase/response regulator [Deferrisomatales bacterium]
MRPAGQSLITRLAVAFGALALVATLASAGLTWHLGRQALLSLSLSRLDAEAEAREQSLTRWVNELRLELRVQAGTPELWSHLWESLAHPPRSVAATQARAALAAQLDALASRQGIDEVFLLSVPGGQVLASSRRGREGSFRTRLGYFLEGRERPFLEGVYASPETGRPAITAAAPVVDAVGRVAAVLGAHLNLGALEGHSPRGPGAEGAAQSFLVDRNHTPFAADRFRTAEFPRGLHSPAVEAAVGGGRGASRYVNHAGVPVLGAYRWLDALGLALIAEAAEREVLAPVRRLTWMVVLSGLALGAAGVVAGRLLARRVAVPLLQVAAAAEGLAAGRLGERAPVRSDDEVGALARSFNRMAGELQELTAAMEDQITQARAAQGALRESEERYRLAVEGNQDLVYLVRLWEDSGRNRLELVNAQAAEALGVTAEELCRDPALRRDAVHPDDAPAVAEAVRRVVTTGVPQTRVYRLRNRTTGAWRWFEDRTTAVEDAAGRRVAIHGVARDVTERIRAEETRDHRTRQERLAAVGQLAAGIAHDFNNLLMTVMGTAELLADDPSLGPEQRERAETISRQGERAAHLVRQILDFGRASVSRLQPVDLAAAADEARRLLARTLPETIEVLVAAQPGIWVQADPTQLQQVILNLALNARDAMPGGGALTLEVDRLAVAEGDVPPVADLSPGPWARLAVADTGTGIAPEHLDRLFEPFFTTKEPGQGTGLGLSQVYGLVRKHGGHTAVASTPGRGTRFTAYLPAIPAPALPAAPAPVRARTAPGGDGRTVLLVEDEEGVRAVCAAMLGRLGYTVVEASCGADGLAAYAARPGQVAAVLTDLVMPGMGGLELARALLGLDPDARIVVMSGYPRGEPLAGGTGIELAGRLEKPLRLAELAEGLRRALGTPGA